MNDFLQQAQLFASQHLGLVVCAYFLFVQVTYALPEPEPSSRWYRFLYILLHQVALNLDKVSAARGWQPMRSQATATTIPALDLPLSPPLAPQPAAPAATPSGGQQ